MGAARELHYEFRNPSGPSRPPAPVYFFKTVVLRRHHVLQDPINHIDPSGLLTPPLPVSPIPPSSPNPCGPNGGGDTSQTYNQVITELGSVLAQLALYYVEVNSGLLSKEQLAQVKEQVRELNNQIQQLNQDLQLLENQQKGTGNCGCST